MNLDIINFIGYFATVFSILGFLSKSDSKSLIYMSLFNLFLWSHYLLLWLYSGAFSLYFDIVKNMFSLKYKNNILTLSIFSLITLAIWYFTYDGTYSSFLPIIAPLIWTLWIFTLSWVHLRYIFLTCNLIWLIYNILVWSLPGIILWIINLIAIAIGISRFYKQQRYAK